VRKFVLRALSGTILLTFVLLFCASASATTITKMLEEDTKLVPPGLMAVNSIPVFKKGTMVTLNENGEVIEGTLASDPWLNCVSLLYEENGRRYFIQYGYVFREGTKVLFNNKGEVVKGTFSHNHQIQIAVPINSRSKIVLRPLTEVSFHPNGVLAQGTIDLYAKTYLRPVGWQQINNSDNPGGFVQFGDGTVIELNDKGEVTKGTLNKDTKLLSPDGNIKVYEAGTNVEFGVDGRVLKVSK
jgi:hypothetical protein